MTKSETIAKASAVTGPSSGGTSAASSTTTGSKTTPKDAQVVNAILKDMTITDYEPRVVHQLIEFTYRYVANVLEDANKFSSYAKKKTIDTDDVRLAIQMQVDKSFTSPPPRDLLLEIARNKNNQTLPQIKSHNGPRLPADRYSLVAANFRQISSKPKQSSSSQPSHIQLPFRPNSGASILNAATMLKTPGSSGVRTGMTIIQSRPSNTSILDAVSGVKRKLDN